MADDFIGKHIQGILKTLRINISLRPAQETALAAFAQGQDTVCLLPTGFGKSLIYQLAPYLKASLLSKDVTSYAVLVISPLNSIMRDQVRGLCKKGIPACYLDIKGQSGKSFALKAQQDEEQDESLSSGIFPGTNFTTRAVRLSFDENIVKCFVSLLYKFLFRS